MTDVEKKARLYHALGEQNRLKILLYLLSQKEPVCICCISKQICKDQSVAFRHIQLLKEVGLVFTSKVGSYLYCSIKDRQKTRRLMEG